MVCPTSLAKKTKNIPQEEDEQQDGSKRLSELRQWASRLKMLRTCEGNITLIETFFMIYGSDDVDEIAIVLMMRAQKFNESRMFFCIFHFYSFLFPSFWYESTFEILTSENDLSTWIICQLYDFRCIEKGSACVHNTLYRVQCNIYTHTRE